ncbi:hypothetical protein [Halovenus halobia]|uniref:hypothetical protein n=1 Tax=Halovenus halobia TaxID=3396622 RepID=UPI003F56E07D
METPEPRGADILYGAFLFGVIAALALEAVAALVALPVVIGVVDWVEYRDRLSTDEPLAVVLTILGLSCLLLCCRFDSTQLGTYVGLVGVVFFLQAVRFVLLTNPAPSRLFRQGYPSLVGLSIICSALADGIPQFQWVPVWLLAGVYVFRKLYVRW